MKRLNFGSAGELAVSPVPATDQIRISRSGPATEAALLNLQGQTLLRAVLTEAGTTMDVSALPAGLYLLRTADGIVRKIMKR